MAVKKTKKLSSQTTTTTVATGEKFAKVDTNGNVTLIDLANLKTALLGGFSLDIMLDGVFIMYHRKFDNYQCLAKPNKWTALQNAGEIAEGVLIVEGGKNLLVAPTESESTGLAWSSAPINGGTTTTTNREIVMSDFNGKSNTASIISKSTSTAVTNTSAYAPGFCNLYSRVNANGEGVTAGKWWLPSVGEMMMIFANVAKINYCLGLISNATLLSTNATYWTSNEASEKTAWRIPFIDGLLGYWYAKDSFYHLVRPVSTFGS